MNPRRKSDYDYIIEVIEILRSEYGLNFFITSSDFDQLYRWWEKGLTMRLLRKSFDSVTNRWKKRGKQISGLSNFSYEVKKNLKREMELNVNLQSEEDRQESFDMSSQDFLERIPVKMGELKEKFKDFFENEKSRNLDCLKSIYSDLVDLHRDDSELSAKKELFFRNISPSLRTSDLERKYSLNILLKRYRIPELERLLL